MASPDDAIPLLGAWWRVRPAGTRFDEYCDVLVSGVSKYGTMDVWRYGAWLPNAFVSGNRLIVSTKAKTSLATLQCRTVRMKRLLVTDPHVDWTPWLEDWQAKRDALIRRLDANEPEDIVLPEGERDGMTVTVAPPLWQVIGDDSASIDDPTLGAVWDPVFDDGHCILVRGAVRAALEGLDGSAVGRLLAFEEFTLPTEGCVRRKPGGWRRPGTRR